MIPIFRVVNCATSNAAVVKNTIFPNPSIYIYTWKHPDGKPTDRQRQSSALDTRSLWVAVYDADHCLVDVKFRERLAVNKQRSQRF
jgi:hypothetical protein